MSICLSVCVCMCALWLVQKVLWGTVAFGWVETLAFATAAVDARGTLALPELTPELFDSEVLGGGSSLCCHANVAHGDRKAAVARQMAACAPPETSPLVTTH